MASNFPTSIDNFSDPGPTTYEDAAGFEHDVVESNQNRAINNIETYVGATGSAVSSTLTYKLNNNVVHNTTDENVAGQKNFTNSDTLFQRAYTKYRPINFLHEDWGVVDDAGASDQSAAMQSALNVGSEEYYLPRATVMAGGLTIAAGSKFVMHGSGAGSRLISPGGTILTVGASGTNSDGIILRDIRVESNTDLAFTTPLVKFIQCRHITLEGIHEILTGSGTAYHFDSSYLVNVLGGQATATGGGVWAEVSNDTSAGTDLDTFTISKVITGKYGILNRGINQNACWNLLNFKVVNTTNDGTNDTTLNGAVSAGATSIVVTSATGLAAGQPLALDYGVKIEVVKIDASYVSGTTIPLKYPARFAHSSGRPVIRGGYAASFPPGASQITVGGRAEQLRAQLLLDDVKGVVVEGNVFMSSKALAIFAGGAPSIQLGSRDMWGYSSVNNSVEVPSWSGSTGGTVRYRRKGRQGAGTAVTELSGTLPAGSTTLYEAQHAGSYTTAARPAATLYDAGAWYWDTTLSRVVWSDGTAWVDSLGSASPTAFARNTTDQTISTTTTMTDAVGTGPSSLMAFAIGVSEVWDFDAIIFYNSGTVPDIKFDFLGPAGATLTYGGTMLRTAAASSSDSITMQQQGTLAGGGTAGNNIARINGLVVNSTTAGNVKLQFAQNTSDAGNTVLLAGSYLKATKRS